jgi:hypothetical protein
MKGTIVAVLLVVAILVGAGAGYFIGVNSAPSSFNTISRGNYYFQYPISINYSGSWNLVYWGTNGTITPYNYTHYNVSGNLNGSGNYERTVATYGVGYVENTFCAKATKLDSQSLILTLTVVDKSNSTNASNPSAEVCFTFAV